MSQDLNNLENAIEEEIKQEEALGVDLTSNRVEQDFVDHNKDKPWWKRLAYRLRDEFQTLVKSFLRKSIEEHIVPEIKKYLAK